jgi:hypothetical protein
MSPLSARLRLPLLALALLPQAARADGPSGDEFFEKEVRPLLAERCLKCHGDTKPKGGLKLISRAAVLRGGDSGPAAVAGKPDGSLLVQAVRYADTPRMPPKAKLADRQIAVLEKWVRLGLPWPEAGATAATPASGAPFRITDEQRRFWSFRPVQSAPPPAVRDARWPRSDLDRFVLAALETKGLRPAPAADRRTLLRRATFDLTGLPPTPAEVDAFLKDTAPGAFARVVDRLLASPAYGERWGRHWLDLVRYTDSFDARGLGGEGDCAHAWRYRDWVVNAFNRDLPYDRFVTEQIAGDLLPAPSGFNREGVIATGFLALGNWGGGDADKEKLLTDIADDQVDAVSRTFLGLTVACARCHDHKFDPISTKDYYGLAGIFFSTHILPNVGPKTNGPPMLNIPLVSPAELAKRVEHAKRLAAGEKHRKAAADRAYAEFARAQLGETAKYLVAAWEYQGQAGRPGAVSPEAFAAARGLHSYALRQWADYLGLGEYRLMTTAVRDVGGKPGVHGWRGAPDCPSLVVNTNDNEVSILTFKLPPRSVAVHPGPSNGVAVAWRSPITGKVSVGGKVVDADPVGGDGIAWVIDHRTAGSRRQLAAGDFPNGGRQSFEQGAGAKSLQSVDVKAGDRIELLVLPRANHGFDTTVVEWTIREVGGPRAWDLRGDVVGDLHQGGKGNPHSDRLGNPAVWHFLDMADSRRAPGPANARPDLAAWDRAVAAGKGARAAVEQAAREIAGKLTTADARSPFWINKREDEKYLPAEARAELAKIDAELEALRKSPPPPSEFANGAQEGGVPGSPHAGTHDVRVHLRGRYDRLGDMAPRHFPEVIAGARHQPITSGSGRLELARWLTKPDNPLTARVMVNRLWQYHFGQGLVRTPSNFGKLGRPPSHPELLDWLARQFVESGWSVKRMHRLLMLSAAYRQSSEAAPETFRADPDNLLLGRMNRRRLEAEAVRDSILAAAGRLDPKRGGPAVRDFAAPRRTLYLMTVRSDRSGFRPLFDSADSTALVDVRTVSTVAPQALFLLNNPFILAQTKALARRVLAEGKDERTRIERAYHLLYARPPLEEEVKIGLDFLARAGRGEAGWEAYCQVLLCANEFIYID